MRTYGNDKKSAIQAKTDAQKIAFAPMMFQAALALRNLGILEYLKNQKNGKSVSEIAKEKQLSEYGVLVLLEAGLSLELVRVKNDIFHLTKTGYFMISDELTIANTDFTNDVNYLGFHHLQESIETGKPTGLHKVFGNWDTVYEALAEMPDYFRKSWFAFDHFYSDDSFLDVMKIIFANNPKKILDVGGNTGKFAIKCAEYSNDVNITILDLPGQIKDAEKNIKEQGFDNRITGYSINLLEFNEHYPKNHDIIWMSQFLDCFSEDEIVKILQKAYDAMDENTNLFIMETFWDKQRFEASTYSLHATSLYFTCIANGNSRMYHSEDMIRLLKKANLKVDEIFENVGISHTILKCVKN